jgi:hypothetical protein
VFVWRFFCQFQTNPVVGDQVEVYLKTGGYPLPTRYDNDDGTGNLALSSVDKLLNLRFLAALLVDQAATGAIMSVGGQVEIPDRFVMPVIYNRTVDQLVAVNNLNGFSLTAVPDALVDV